MPKMTLYPSFSTEKCNALFAEILVNDHVDLNVELCAAIHIGRSLHANSAKPIPDYAGDSIFVCTANEGSEK